MDSRSAQLHVRNLQTSLATLSAIPDDSAVLIQDQLQVIDGEISSVLSYLGYSGSLTIAAKRPLGRITVTYE